MIKIMLHWGRILLSSTKTAPLRPNDLLLRFAAHGQDAAQTENDKEGAASFDVKRLQRHFHSQRMNLIPHSLLFV
jgi:hypothetical protein